MRRISSHFGDPVQPESAVSPNDLVETARHVTVTIEIAARLVSSQAPGRYQGVLCKGGRSNEPRSDSRSIAAENFFHASVGAGLLLPQERLQQSTNFQKETSASLSSP